MLLYNPVVALWVWLEPGWVVVARGYAGLMMRLVPLPSLELPTAVGPSKIAKGAAVGWVGLC